MFKHTVAAGVRDGQLKIAAAGCPDCGSTGPQRMEFAGASDGGFLRCLACNSAYRGAPPPERRTPAAPKPKPRARPRSNLWNDYLKGRFSGKY